MSTNIKGIDVSKHQGTIDWAKVAKDGVKFAMIRIGYGSSNGIGCCVDSFYHKNVEGALANGIAVGCYFYSYALSVEAAKKEAAFVIEHLARYKGKISYPIAFDIEDSSQAGLGKQTLTDMVTAFCSAVEEAGYYASFYCNVDWAKNRLDMQALARFDLWLAQWASAPSYTGHSYNMWQSSSKGSVAGISGNVDMDTAFLDYAGLIKQKKCNGYTGDSNNASASSGSSSESSTNTGASTGETVYTVVTGDTLSKIAAKYGTTVQKLAEYNGIANPDKIYAGQKIKIPGSTGGASAFTAGKHYTLTTNVKVRNGVGVSAAQKKKSELTADGQKHALDQTLAVLKAGTIVIAQVIHKVSDKEYWAKIPSGYIALRYNGEDYVK